MFDGMPSVPAAAKAKAYSYLRFSTPEQMKGDSLRRQSEAAKRYALQHSLELDEELTFKDLGTSAFRGRNAEAGELGAFLVAVEDGLVAPGSWLLVESLDRISRNKARRAVRTLETICDKGITVVTLSDGKVYTEESLDEDPMAFMWAFMVAMRAHEESETKSRRLKAVWESKRANASEKPLTAIAPAWLSLSDDGKWLVNEERACVIRRIYTAAADGIGQHAIARGLNQDNVPCFGKADGWHRSYVKKVLENPAVIGTYVPHQIEYRDQKRVRVPQEPIEGYFPPVVEKGVWETVQALQKSRCPPHHLSKGVAYSLAGLATCPKCGGSMTRVTKGKKSAGPTLVCGRAKRGLGCKYQSVRLADVELAITEGLHEWACAPSVDQSIDKAWESVAGDIEALDDQIRNVAEAIASMGASPSLKAQLCAMEEQRAAAVRDLDALRERYQAASPATLLKNTGALVEAINRASSPGVINTALRRVVEAVEVDYETGVLTFNWRHGGSTGVVYAMPT